MNNSKSLFMAASIFVLLGMAQGCSTNSTSGELAKAEGTMEFRDNTLLVNDAIRLNEVWAAANAALQELQIKYSVNNRSHRMARLEGWDPQNRKVVIQLFWKGRFLTSIQISVGNTDDTKNRFEAEQIYNKIKDRYDVVRPVQGDQP